MPAQGTLHSSLTLKFTSPEQSTSCAADCDQIPNRASACIDVDLLGGLRVRAGQTTMGPRELGGTKLRRVLLALVLHRGSPVSKDQLVSMLWEGSPPSGAKATLESYVCVLRKTLQPCHEVRTSLITTVAGCYAIDMSRVDLDLERYERLMSEALDPAASAKEALPLLQQAMSVVEAPLLPEELECNWLDDMRRTHNQKVRKDLIAAAEKVACLPSRSAEHWARMALDVDPLDEAAWYALLLSMETNEQHADGLRAYARCRGLFAAELGCAPGPRLQGLYLRLLRGANENNAELTRLFDAVARLYAQSQLRPLTPLRVPARERREANSHASSIDEACNDLDVLLDSFGRGRQEPITESEHRATA
jgi:DNA-binding SARP family transcriptional activator